MAETRERAVEELVADFGQRIEALRREGVPSYPPLGGRTPWAEATETEKLEAIVWESMSVWLGAESFAPDAVGPRVIAVPGTAALEAVERHVDVAGLPAVQRALLQDLRARLDAGRLGGPPPEGKDRIGMGLARVVGVGHFDGMVQAAREREDRPWAERPAAEKVRVLVDLAAEAGPPGAYTLATIEREVDYDRLPPWRREALDGLRARIDRGEFDGENPNPLDQGDRAELALRLAELEARVEDDKRLGALDGAGRRWPWQALGEEAKFDQIMWEIRALHLESEPAAYHVLGREVDMRGVGEERRRECAGERREACPGPAETERAAPTPPAAGHPLPSPCEGARANGPTFQQIRGILAEQRQIAIRWTVEDVQAVRPDLDEDRAWQVLQQVEHDHDGDHGITWQTIESRAGELFPEPEIAAPAKDRAEPEGRPDHDHHPDGKSSPALPTPGEILDDPRKFFTPEQAAGQDRGPEHGPDKGRGR